MWATVIGFSIVVVETALAADLPVIHRMLPGALCPGKVTEVTVRGQHLSEVTRVWTSFACKCEHIETPSRIPHRSLLYRKTFERNTFF